MKYPTREELAEAQAAAAAALAQNVPILAANREARRQWVAAEAAWKALRPEIACLEAAIVKATRRYAREATEANQIGLSEAILKKAEAEARLVAGPPRLRLRKLPATLPRKMVAVSKREAAYNAALKKRQAAAWLAKLKEVPTRLRNRVGAIIWWDFFAGQTTGAQPALAEEVKPEGAQPALAEEVKPELAQQFYTFDTADLPAAEVARHLVACGYTETMAHRRVYSQADW